MHMATAKKPAQMSVAEFEAKILEKEEIVIRVRAPAGTLVGAYNYDRKAAGNQSTTDWIEGRIKPLLGGNEFSIIDGDHSTPHGRTKLENVRNSYEK
jgi:hypothetical protein